MQENRRIKNTVFSEGLCKLMMAKLMFWIGLPFPCGIGVLGIHWKLHLEKYCLSLGKE